MTEEKKKEEIKIVTHRLEGLKREYANYIEFYITPRELSLKFCDIKPLQTEEEYKKAEEEGKIEVAVNSEYVIPFDVADEVVKKLQEHIDKIKRDLQKEEK